MLDFQKLIVYQKSLDFYSVLNNEIIDKKLTDKIAKDQLRRALMSITLNIAEGTSRFSSADRKRFYTMARGSLYECVAILDLLKRDFKIDESMHADLCSKAEVIVKMLFTMEKQLSI